ncbi:MAG: bidirectional hydrogenase complex protein HoxE [Deltaproteobacteria bacterium]|nr:bidirectional hydrogenase complex protein HoxE [Deltaproteobacteria bacterium]
MPEPTPAKKDAAKEKEHPMGDPRYKGIDRVLKRQQYQQDALIEVLTAAQEAFGYLTEESLIYIARQLKLPFSWVYGVATFYHFFSLKPQGEHSAIVCLGTACYVGKAAEIVESLEREFCVKAGQTTSDGKLTVTTTRCLGCCGLAPVVVLDNNVLGKETPETTLAKVRQALGGGNGGNGGTPS